MHVQQLPVLYILYIYIYLFRTSIYVRVLLVLLVIVYKNIVSSIINHIINKFFLSSSQKKSAAFFSRQHPPKSVDWRRKKKAETKNTCEKNKMFFSLLINHTRRGVQKNFSYTTILPTLPNKLLYYSLCWNICELQYPPRGLSGIYRREDDRTRGSFKFRRALRLKILSLAIKYSTGLQLASLFSAAKYFWD